MKKILIVLFLCIASSVCMADIVIDNQTAQAGKIAVQWANSVEATQKMNKTLDAGSLQMLAAKGGNRLTPPEGTQYFRIVAWSSGEAKPDLLTNWVSIVADKTYTLTQDKLTPAVLMAGSGC